VPTLAALTAAGPPRALDLVDLARQGAAESHGDGRAAWLLVAVAFAAAPTPAGARVALERAIDSTELRSLAPACLAVLEDTVH
jgi:hypothetical protein